jgi:pimeloyl-ACP methyl ester carboxylesterase
VRRRLVAVGDRHADVYEPFGQDPLGVVLLLHGSGPSEREVMAPLAARFADTRVVVVASDWDASSRSVADELDAALMLAAELMDDGRLVVAGWSAGGSATWWLACRHPELVVGVVFLASSVAGIEGLEDEAEVSMAPMVPVLAVTGSDDMIVLAEASAGAIRRLGSLGLEMQHVVLDADHAGVIGCVYDPAAGRCVESAVPAVVAAGDACASAILGLIAGRSEDG